MLLLQLLLVLLLEGGESFLFILQHLNPCLDPRIDLVPKEIWDENRV